MKRDALNRVQLIYARPPKRWLTDVWVLLVLSVFVMAAGAAAGLSTRIEPPLILVLPHAMSIPEMVVHEAVEQGLPSHWVAGIMWTETNLCEPLRACLVLSRTLDAGPLQVNLPTAMRRGLNPIALLDPINSTRTAVSWLKEYQHCGGLREVVWAYAHGRCQEKRR